MLLQFAHLGVSKAGIWAGCSYAAAFAIILESKSWARVPAEVAAQHTALFFVPTQGWLGWATAPWALLTAPGWMDPG